MVGFDSEEGLDALPRRIFLEGEQRPSPTMTGSSSRSVLTPKHLLQEAAVLAVAPPWTGKTTVGPLEGERGHCLPPGVMDRAPLRVIPAVPFIDRETLAARDTRNDLKIQASSYEGKPLAVIIEVKWSDHRDVSTSLVDQLGYDYLLQNGHTHGIYLVGWTGEPGNPKKASRGKRRTPRADFETLQQTLEEQAQLFTQDHPGHRVTPFILDLSW